MKHFKTYENIFDIQKVETNLKSDIIAAADDEDNFMFLPFTTDTDQEEFNISSRGKSEVGITYAFDQPINTEYGWFTYWIYYYATIVRNHPAEYIVNQIYKMGAKKHAVEGAEFENIVNTEEKTTHQTFNDMIEYLDTFYMNNDLDKHDIKSWIENAMSKL